MVINGHLLGLVAIVLTAVVVLVCVVLKSVENILWHQRWIEKNPPLQFNFSERKEETEEEIDDGEKKQ